MSNVFVRRGGSETGNCEVILDSTKNLQTGEPKFRSYFGPPTSLESDLLVLGAAVLAADRCIVRGEREDYTRGIELSIPVTNIGVLQPFATLIEDILRTLSNDGWRVNFRQHHGQPEHHFGAQEVEGSTLLFSGGLDSFAAAVEFGHQNQSLQLVSHRTMNRQTNSAQDALTGQLTSAGFNFTHRAFLVSARSVSPGDQLHFDVETSQRTRSFLFLILAALCARRAGHRQIVMIAENGQFAIHLPLTQGRIGAFSTHTAHPDVLARMQTFLREVLDTPFSIINPYVHRTKAEVVEVIWNHARAAIPVSTSCWRNARLPSPANHCGVCVPCLIRRIAIETHGHDPTHYAEDAFTRDISQLPANDEGRRNLADLAEFVLRMERGSQIEIMTEWPELFSPQIDPASTIAMYKRAAVEARGVLSRYPCLTPLLQ